MNETYSLCSGGMKLLKDPKLSIGQICFLNGYGESKGSNHLAVYEINKTDFGNFYKTVDIDKAAPVKTIQYVESSDEIFGIGTYYYDPPQYATQKQIDEGLRNAKIFDRKETEKKQRISEGIAKQIETLKKQYAHLARTEGSNKPSHIIAAKNIRTELKDKMPGIKFSVKCQSYSGGDSINISCKALTEFEGKTLDRITGKYEQGEFNGMEDIYEYNNNPFNDLFGGTKYIF